MVSSLRDRSLTIVLSELRRELSPLYFQQKGLPKLSTSFSLHHKPQEKCRLPFSPSLRRARVSSFAPLSALFQLHSAAYVYSGLHQLDVHVWGSGLACACRLCRVFFFYCLVQRQWCSWPARSLHPSVLQWKKGRCEWSKFRTKRSNFDFLMIFFFGFVFFPLCTTLFIFSWWGFFFS